MIETPYLVVNFAIFIFAMMQTRFPVTLPQLALIKTLVLWSAERNLKPGSSARKPIKHVKMMKNVETTQGKE